MLRLFKYDHLPEHLQEVSRPFHDLAAKLCERKRAIGDGREDFTCEVLALHQLDVAMQHLLEAKDAAVRAAVVYADR